MNTILWQPTAERINNSNISAFLGQVQSDIGVSLSNYEELYSWSLAEKDLFWEAVRSFCDISFHSPHSSVLEVSEPFYRSRWYPGATLSFAEHLLWKNDDEIALYFCGEGRVERSLSYRTLRAQVAALRTHLLEHGIGKGDRVAAVMPNTPETIVAMLAANSLGAIWSSCSPDFGVAGILDRFSQIEPTALIICDGYFFKGKWIHCAEKIQHVVRAIPSLRTLIACSYEALSAEKERAQFADIADSRLTSYAEVISTHAHAALAFELVDFSHPLFIMFSSGTTGKPKCIVHGCGGVLLEHKKELMLHTDLKQGDVFFYQTTCGWMMWNWLVSGLSVGATLVLYDGSPFHEDGKILWRLAEEKKISHFGTNAKYLSALEKSGAVPKNDFDLSCIQTVLSTGSSLLPESFDYVYGSISKDLCLSSISGGTDIVGCFALGCPILPVRRAELQCRSLGIEVDVFRADGSTAESGEQGELVCLSAFPSMPVAFWNDPNFEKYHASYFSRFPGVWTHGDFVELRPEGGMIFYGRSDATLNPGGVRIGTAEIYRQVEAIDAIEESIVVGQPWEDDVRIVLFVVLKAGFKLDETLREAIRKQIRENTSPFHVPKQIIAVPEIPRTRSGKIVELAVRDILAGRTPANTEALANPDALEYFRNREELQ